MLGGVWRAWILIEYGLLRRGAAEREFGGGREVSFRLRGGRAGLTCPVIIKMVAKWKIALDSGVGGGG